MIGPDPLAPAVPLRVMLVDDHEVVLQGVRTLLEPLEDIIVVTQAASVSEAITEAQRSRPDVIVMDVRLGDGTGIEATREIRVRCPSTRVLMLTSFSDEEALFASIMAGASGYVLKQIRSGELVDAIRTVGRGGSLLGPGVADSVLQRLRNSSALVDQKLERLTAQEERILAGIAEGKSNAEIGHDLCLAEKTVKNYVSSILSKLEVTRRTEAAIYLRRSQP